MADKNTAQLRNEAREAEKSLKWVEAARLYDLAADRYPTQSGALAKADVQYLRQRARSCRATQAFTDYPEFADGRFVASVA